MSNETESKKLIELSKKIHATMPVPKKEPWSVPILFSAPPHATCVIELWMGNMYKLERVHFDVPDGLMARIAFAARNDLEEAFTKGLIADERAEHDELPAKFFSAGCEFKSRSPHYKIVVTVRNTKAIIVGTKLELGGHLIPGMNIHGMTWIAYVDGVQVAEKRSHTPEEVDRAFNEALGDLPKRT